MGKVGRHRNENVVDDHFAAWSRYWAIELPSAFAGPYVITMRMLLRAAQVENTL